MANYKIVLASLWIFSSCQVGANPGVFTEKKMIENIQETSSNFAPSPVISLDVGVSNPAKISDSFSDTDKSTKPTGSIEPLSKPAKPLVVASEVISVSPAFVSRGGSGGASINPSVATNSAGFNITKVVLNENRGNISGSESPFALNPVFEGTYIEVLIEGSFFDENGRNVLSVDQFMNPNNDNYLQKSLVIDSTNSTLYRVLLDDSIVLEPVEVQGNVIKVRLNTSYIPDLYLIGPHKLSIESQAVYSDIIVNIREPKPITHSLIPEVFSVEVLKNAEGQSTLLKVKGKHLMLHPKFAYATIDDEFGFGYQTTIFSKELSETLIHIPDPLNFNVDQPHTFVYSTPHGTAFYAF